jgi:hypothetical protein
LNPGARLALNKKPTQTGTIRFGWCRLSFAATNFRSKRRKRVGINLKSYRISTLKVKLLGLREKKLPYYQLACLEELLGIKTISYRNCLYAQKYIATVRDLYPDDPEVQAKFNALNERIEAAAERRRRRKEKRDAAKGTGLAPKKRGRSAKPEPTPPPEHLDPWRL